jgi:hypothetical protein
VNTRHAHPRATFPEALAAANLGPKLEPLARERLQYLASMEDNSVDIEMFKFALEEMIDSTPGLAATLASTGLAMRQSGRTKRLSAAEVPTARKAGFGHSGIFGHARLNVPE